MFAIAGAVIGGGLAYGLGATALGVAGGAAAGGLLGSSFGATRAADSATDAQVQAANTASNTEMAMFNRGVELMAPWREAGKKGLGKLEEKIYAGPGDFTESPGYAFRRDEGKKAIERSAAARGGLVSGRTAKALERFGQDYATSEYDNFRRRYFEDMAPLQSIAGVGQTTASQTALMGEGVASRVGGNQMAAGQARASGYANKANIWTDAFQGGLNAFGSYKGWG